MKKKTWDLYAPIYKRAMQADHKIYEFMYDRIPQVIKRMADYHEPRDGGTHYPDVCRVCEGE